MAQSVLRPVAEGSLRDTPLAHVLLHIHGRGLDGTLVVHAASGAEALIRIVGGRPQAGRFSQRVSPDLLAAIVPLCSVADGRYEFHAADLLTGVGTVLRGSVDPFALVAESVRRYVRTDVADALLARYGDHLMRLQPGQPVSRLNLNSREVALLEVLRAGPDTVARLVRMCPLGERETRNLLYLLVITRMVGPYERSTSSSHIRMASVSPEALPDGSSTPPGSGDMSKEAHAAVRAIVRQTSLTPAPFAAVMARPRSSAPPRASAEYHMDQDDPDTKFRLAEKRLLSGRPEDALFMAEELLTTDAHSPRFLGLRAYALMACHRPSDTSLSPEVTTAIQEALVADENESRALYAKGLAFSHMGKLKNALHYFRRAAAADPTFIPAKRDAHLAEMRLRPSR